MQLSREQPGRCGHCGTASQETNVRVKKVVDRT
jgi:hypothetical protein